MFGFASSIVLQVDIIVSPNGLTGVIVDHDGIPRNTHCKQVVLPLSACPPCPLLFQLLHTIHGS